MEILNLIVLLFIAFGAGSASADNTRINGPELQILKVSKSSIVHLKIENHSTSEEIRIWREHNSWGAAHWRIFILRGEQLITLFQKNVRGFTRNVPSYDTIAPGRAIEKTLNINDEIWHGANGKNIKFVPGDILIVSYDVPEVDICPCSELSLIANENHVWNGVIAARKIVQ